MRHIRKRPCTKLTTDGLANGVLEQQLQLGQCATLEGGGEDLGTL